MKRKNPETYQRNLQFLSGERLETILSTLQKFFPADKELIQTLQRKDLDMMLMRIMRSEVVHLQGEGERLVQKGRNVLMQFGFIPPVAFFFAFNGAELFDAMIERIHQDLRKRGRPQGLSDIWKRLSAPLMAGNETKTVFTKDLLFKIRQRLKNYLEKDRRFVIDAKSPKKLYLRLTEWGDKPVDLD
ncbi:MAG TPA: hypothetical protein PKO06_18470 [Candidatus Ozemobacteraceae bacterium]|nr:hypothetical protein [Candidatus Ozemobacteraceae bacterium]